MNNCQNLSGKNFETIIEEASDCVALLPGIVDYQESDLLIDLINNESGEFKFDIFDEGNDDANTVKEILRNIKDLFTSLHKKLPIETAIELRESFTNFQNNYVVHTEIYDIADSIGANTAELNTSGITMSHWDNENFAPLFDSTLTYEMGVSSREGNLNDYNKKYEEPHFFNEIKFADLSEILKELRSTLKTSIKSDVEIEELNYVENSGRLDLLDDHDNQIKQYYKEGSNWDKTTLNNHKLIFNTIVGGLSISFLGKRILKLIADLFKRIPVLRTIYSAIVQMTETFSNKDENGKKSGVLIEYPRKGVWAVGFATKENKGEMVEKTNKKLINVFVPTTPNPTSGFLLMFPIDEVIYLNMTFEEASKFIVSAGTSTGKN